MNPKRRAILDQPSGTEGLQLRETWNHKRLVGELSALMERWGYLPIRTPVLDYYDAFAPLLSDGHTGAMYRLIDREGDILAVRPDATLFLAKQVARILRSDDLPVRVYYAETILRPDDRRNISRNEFFQIGAELIGNGTTDGDLEVAVLLMQLLDSVLPEQSVLHIGSRVLADEVTGTLSEPDAEAFRRALALHDDPTCRSVLAVSDVGAESADTIMGFLLTIGTAAETGTALAVLERELGRVRGSLSARFLEEARRLIHIAKVLEELYGGGRIRVDPSETGSQGYHSGVAFQAYAPGAEAAVASGGRYDTLYGHFGLETPAVGFSIMLRRLERLKDTGGLPTIEQVKADGRKFLDRLREAEEARRFGRNTSL